MSDEWQLIYVARAGKSNVLPRLKNADMSYLLTLHDEKGRSLLHLLCERGSAEGIIYLQQHVEPFTWKTLCAEKCQSGMTASQYLEDFGFHHMTDAEYNYAEQLLQKGL